MKEHTSQIPQQESLLIKLLTKYRTIVILFIVLPSSFLYERIIALRNWIYWRILATPPLHDARVKQVQKQVMAWHNSGSIRPMCTARPGWKTMSPRTANFKKDCHPITINLRDILNVDIKKQIIRVEPLVTMGQLTTYLLPMGYALALMVEMEDLTVGGLVMGVGMETNSHRVGLIQETVVAYELILGDGSLIRATATENSDLFYALPWSHGTLGFLVAIELKIIPIKSHMHLTYIPCHSLDEMCKLAESLANAEDGPAFLEVTVFNKEQSVIMCGDFADLTTAEEKAKVNRVNFWFKPWFYKHVETFLIRGKSDEYIPLKHYYHRHSRSIFWELESMIPFGNHPLYRWLLGWLGAPKVSFLKLTMTPKLRREGVKMHVIQDYILPITELKKSILLSDELFNIYPMLIFFIRIYDHGTYQGFLRKPENLSPGHNHGLYFDIGIYGIPSAIRNKQPWDVETTVKKAEQYARDAKGYQCLYADIFSTREEFEHMFDHSLYKQMRQKYKAENAFPDIYDKVKGEW